MGKKIENNRKMIGKRSEKRSDKRSEMIDDRIWLIFSGNDRRSDLAHIFENDRRSDLAHQKSDRSKLWYIGGWHFLFSWSL